MKLNINSLTPLGSLTIYTARGNKTPWWNDGVCIACLSDPPRQLAGCPVCGFSCRVLRFCAGLVQRRQTDTGSRSSQVQKGQTAWPIDFHCTELAATAARRFIPALFLIRPHQLPLDCTTHKGISVKSSFLRTVCWEVKV